MIEKPFCLRDPKAVKAARKPYCEYCGRYGPVIVHHYNRTRGAGGDDIYTEDGSGDDNLISLCPECERKAHNAQISKSQLREAKACNSRVLKKFFKDW